MPAYNAAKTLEQTYRELPAEIVDQVILTDDGSTDETPYILSEYAARDSRIRVISTAQQGLTAALRLLCQKAVAPYLARMDADDIAMKNRLAHQYAYMEAHPDLAASGTQGIIIDTQGKEVGKKIFPTEHKEIHKRLLFNNQFIHSSLMFRRELLLKNGSYNVNFRRSQDYELMLRLASRHEVGNVPEVLMSWRVHAHSLSWTSKAQERDALRARVLAIREYGYSFFLGSVFILIRCFWILLPQSMKRRRYAS